MVGHADGKAKKPIWAIDGYPNKVFYASQASNLLVLYKIQGNLRIGSMVFLLTYQSRWLISLCVSKVVLFLPLSSWNVSDLLTPLILEVPRLLKLHLSPYFNNRRGIFLLVYWFYSFCLSSVIVSPIFSWICRIIRYFPCSKIGFIFLVISSRSELSCYHSIWW